MCTCRPSALHPPPPRPRVYSAGVYSVGVKLLMSVVPNDFFRFRRLLVCFVPVSLLSIKPSCIVSILSVCVCLITYSISLAQPAFLLLFRRVPSGRGGKKCEINSEERIALEQIHSPHCRPCAESAGGSTRGFLRSAERMFYKLAVRAPPPFTKAACRKDPHPPFSWRCHERECAERT